MTWLTGYTYRKKGSVVATTAGAQTLYQLKLNVGESSSASGEDVDCETHCEDFPNDIRFTKEDGVTKQDYRIEPNSITGTTPNRLATVVIEVSSIPALGSVDFYMYYGKSGDIFRCEICGLSVHSETISNVTTSICETTSGVCYDFETGGINVCTKCLQALKGGFEDVISKLKEAQKDEYNYTGTYREDEGV